MAKWNLFARSSEGKAHDVDDVDDDSMLHGRISSHVLNVILHTLRILAQIKLRRGLKRMHRISLCDHYVVYFEICAL